MHHSLIDSSIPLTTPAPARPTDSPCHRQCAPLGSSLAAVGVRRALAPARRALAQHGQCARTVGGPMGPLD
jgi:hypothetical protein